VTSVNRGSGTGSGN